MLSGNPWDDPLGEPPSSGDDPPFYDPPDNNGGDDPPEGDPTAGPTELAVSGLATTERGQQYSLELTVSNPPTGWVESFIDWGDGSDPDNDGLVGQLFASLPSQVSHFYRKGGRFTVFVAARDECGNVYSATTSVEVAGPRVPEIEGLALAYEAGLPLIQGRVVDDESVALAPVEFDTNGDGLADGVLYADPNGSGEFWFNPAAYSDPDGNGSFAFRAAQRDPDGSFVFGPWASISVVRQNDPSEVVPVSPACAALTNSIVPAYQIRPMVDTPRSPVPVFVTGGWIAGGEYATFAWLRWEPTQGSSWSWLDSPGTSTTTVQWTDVDGAWTRIETTNKVHEILADWSGDDYWSYSEQVIDQQTITIVFDGDDIDWEYTYIVDRSFSFVAWRNGADQYYVMSESFHESFDYSWIRLVATNDLDHVLEASFAEAWSQSFERHDLGHRWRMNESVFENEITTYEAAGDHSRAFAHDEYRMLIDGQWTSCQWFDQWENHWSYEVERNRTAQQEGPLLETRSFDFQQSEAQSLTSLVEAWSRQDQDGWWGIEKRTDLFSSDSFEKTLAASLHVWGATDYSNGAPQTQSSYVATFAVEDALTSAFIEQIATDDRRLAGVTIETGFQQNRSITRERHFDQQIAADQTFEGNGNSSWSFAGTVSGENITVSNWAVSFANELVGNDASVVGTARTLHVVESGDASGANFYRILADSGFEGSGYADCSSIASLAGTTEVWQSAAGNRSWQRETESTAIGQTVSSENGWTLTTASETLDRAGESGQGSFVAQSYDRVQVQPDGIVIRIGSASHQAQTQGVRTAQYEHRSVVSAECHPESNVTETSSTATSVERIAHAAFTGQSQGTASYDVLGRSRLESSNYQENGTEREEIVEQVTTARVDSRDSGFIVNSLFTGQSFSTRDGTTSFEHTAAYSAADDSFIAQTTRSELAQGTTLSNSCSVAWSLTEDRTVGNKSVSTETTDDSATEAAGTYRYSSYSSAQRDHYNVLELYSQSGCIESGVSRTFGTSRTDYCLDDRTGPVRHIVVSSAEDGYERNGAYSYSANTIESVSANGIHETIETVDRRNSEGGVAGRRFESISTALGTESPTSGVTRTVSSSDSYSESREGTSERTESFVSTKRMVNGSIWYASTETVSERERGDFWHARNVSGVFQTTDISESGITITEESETTEISSGGGDFDSGYYFERNVIDDQWSTISWRADHTASESQFRRRFDTRSERTDRSREGYDRYVRAVSHVFETGVEIDWLLDIASDERRFDGAVFGTARREDERHLNGRTDSDYSFFEKVAVDHVARQGVGGTRHVAVTTTQSERSNSAEFEELTVLIREATGNDVLASEYSTRSEKGTFSSSQIVHVGGDPEQPGSMAWTVAFNVLSYGAQIVAGNYLNHAESYSSGNYEISIDSIRETDASGRVQFANSYSYSENGERLESSFGQEHTTAFEIHFGSGNTPLQSADFLEVEYSVAIQNINNVWNHYSADGDEEGAGEGEGGQQGNPPEEELPLFVSRTVRAVYNGRPEGETTGASITEINEYRRSEETTETADYGQLIPLVVKDSAYSESGVTDEQRWESTLFESIDRRPEPFTEWYQTTNRATIGSHARTTTEFTHSAAKESENGPAGGRSGESVENVDASSFRIVRSEANRVVGTALVLNAGPGQCRRTWSAQSETAKLSQGDLTVKLTVDESYGYDGTRTRSEREITSVRATTDTDTHLKQDVVETQQLPSGSTVRRSMTREESERRFDRVGNDSTPSITTVSIEIDGDNETITRNEKAVESGWNRWKSASSSSAFCAQQEGPFFVSQTYQSQTSDDGGYDDENGPYGGSYSASRDITEVTVNSIPSSKSGSSASSATIKGRAVESSVSTRKAESGVALLSERYLLASQTTEINRAPSEGDSFEAPSRTYEITSTHNIDYSTDPSGLHSGQTIATVRVVERRTETRSLEVATRTTQSGDDYSGFEENSDTWGFASTDYRTVVKRIVIALEQDGSEAPAEETIVSNQSESEESDWKITENRTRFEGRLSDPYGVYADAVSESFDRTEERSNAVVVVMADNEASSRSESRGRQWTEITTRHFNGSNTAAAEGETLSRTRWSSTTTTIVQSGDAFNEDGDGLYHRTEISSSFDRRVWICDGQPQTDQSTSDWSSEFSYVVQTTAIALPGVLGQFVSVVAQEVAEVYRGLVCEVMDQAITVVTFTACNFGRIVDAGLGFIDGFLDAINPFDQWFSIPDIGPYFGHVEFYTGGYVVGMIGGMAASFTIGAAAGGGLVACSSKLALAAQIYTGLDFVAFLGAGLQAGYNLYNGNAGLSDLLALGQLLMPLAGYGLKKLGVLGKPHCFLGGTQVVVGRDSDGSYITRSIEEIEEGDLILARDQFSAESAVELCRVARVYVSYTDTLRVIVLRDASGNEETITTTDEHPFWVDRFGWVEAGDLQLGQVVLTATGGRAMVVGSRRVVLDAPVAVYNLEVAGAHTYFVEDGLGRQTPLWVHNNCADKIIGLAHGDKQHRNTIDKLAQKWSKRSDVQAVYLNRAVRTATGGVCDDLRRPDLIIKFKNGTYALIEVQSKSQKESDLVKKLGSMLNLLGTSGNAVRSRIYDLFGKAVR